MVELVELIGKREEGQEGRWVDGSCSPPGGEWREEANQAGGRRGEMEGRAVGGGMIVK